MIDKLSYEEVQAISNELKNLAQTIDKLVEGKGATQLEDFSATVEGYSKFLENTIEINKDADKALQELKDSIK
jgi:hypothetical protein